MPLVGCALVPNSPLLLPGLSPEARQKVAKVTAALERLAGELYARQPDVAVVLAESSDFQRPTLLQNQEFKYQFAELGDLATQGSCRGALGFTHRMKERYETSYPIPLMSPEFLPPAAGIPLVVLPALANSCSVAVLMLPPQLTADDIKHLGQVLSAELTASRERVVLMACGTLAVHGKRFAADATVYDKAFLSSLAEHASEGLLNLDSELRNRVEETLWAPTCVMRSARDEISLACEIIEYGAPCGVGLVVAANI